MNRTLQLGHSPDPDDAFMFFALAKNRIDTRGWAFEHILQAKMSIQYNVAAALTHASFAESNYVPQQNPEVQALAKRVVVEIDPGFTSAFPAKQGAAVVVRLRDGRTLEQSADNVEPTDPDGVHERFFAAAASTLGETHARELDALIGTLESCADAATLARLTSTARSAA
jgi:2-methylcitrate dehydratase PrpD